MTVLQHEKFNRESDEFLQAEEHAEMVGEEEVLVAGNLDTSYRNQNSEELNQFEDSDVFKYQIVNRIWTPFARSLWKQFKELRECNPSTILFLSVPDGKKKYRGKPLIMDCATISKRWTEIVEQICRQKYTHVITIYQGNVEKFEQTNNQMLVHLYNAMRQIRQDGTLRDYDLRAFSEVYAHLKAGWDREGSCIPNLIDTGNWLGMHQQQGQLFGEDRSGENAQAKDF